MVEVSLDTDFEKKEDKRESRKADKKAREEAESTGATVHTWNGETRRGLAGSPTKSPSSGLHKVKHDIQNILSLHMTLSPSTSILTNTHSILFHPSFYFLKHSLPGSLHPNQTNTVSSMRSLMPLVNWLFGDMVRLPRKLVLWLMQR